MPPRVEGTDVKYGVRRPDQRICQGDIRVILIRAFRIQCSFGKKKLIYQLWSNESNNIYVWLNAAASKVA
eukprot:scaffold111061_cov35-Prasinocladus_malaysianus.AAC.1